MTVGFASPWMLLGVVAAILPLSAGHESTVKMRSSAAWPTQMTFIVPASLKRTSGETNDPDLAPAQRA